jgi:hypothetical protein
MTSKEQAYVEEMERRGVLRAETVLECAKRAGVKLSLGIGLLEQEASRDGKIGLNVWGNDRAPNGGTSDWGWDEVNESNYRQYKQRRGPTGQGGRQGAGPTQLTWHTLQDAADRLGGCWKPENSILVGFTHLKSLIDEHGYVVGVERYNGVGRVEYSESVRGKASRWADVLRDAGREEEEAPEHDPEEEGDYPEVHFGDSGPGIEKLQQALNRHAGSGALDLWEIDVDGTYGPLSHGLAVEVVYGLGVYSRRIRGDALSSYAHELTIEPDRRNATQKQRAEERAREEPAAGERIVSAAEAGIRTHAVFGGLGPETRVSTHYSAGPRARNLAEGLRIAREHDRFHAAKGWGGSSYHFNIPDTGEIICARPVSQKGAGVKAHNSNNVHVHFYGTTGDRPTRAQIETAKWLVANAHTAAMPSGHRTDRDLRQADIRGHNQWPDQSTGCPGHYTPEGLELK